MMLLRGEWSGEPASENESVPRIRLDSPGTIRYLVIVLERMRPNFCILDWLQLPAEVCHGQ